MESEVIKNKQVTIHQRNEECSNFFDQCLEILEKKGNDYNSDSDGFRTLKENAELIGVPLESIIFMLMNKHFKSVQRYCQNGSLQSEEIGERLMDLANYSAILYTWLKSQNKISSPQKKLEASKEFLHETYKLLQNVEEDYQRFNEQSGLMSERKNFLYKRDRIRRLKVFISGNFSGERNEDEDKDSE